MDWRRIKVSEDGTHHIVDGQELYAERFDMILKYHAPGLAPVQTGDSAWHIDQHGRAVYARRFARTFGFYENRATVCDHGGNWFHICPDGEDVYPERYVWCGNFQEGLCPVRDMDGHCFHIDRNGKRMYEDSWRYAGDFRDGIAVVQADDGRSTHITRQGEVVHQCWFHDLDVFHKGFARAKDDIGWMHVNMTGKAMYARRFAMVEPFYNGQARVERFDGGLEIIDEGGNTMHELRPAQKDDFHELSADMVGFWRTQAIAAAVELGIFDHLPGTIGQLAADCGLLPERAERLMHALGELRLVNCAEHTWHASSKGQYLKRSHAETLADAAVEYGGPMSKLWQNLSEAFRNDSAWVPPDIFKDVATDQVRVSGHHRMLRSYARHDYSAIADVLPLAGDETVIDAGGGLGVISELLLLRYPKLRVVLLDRPEVIAAVRPDEIYGDRLTLKSCDLFMPWDEKADIVILARVLHDWPDEETVEILKNARTALRPGGHIFIVEMLLGDPVFFGSLCDLHLLMVTGGKERTRQEYEHLLNRSGFAFDSVRTSNALPRIIGGTAI